MTIHVNSSVIHMTTYSFHKRCVERFPKIHYC